MARPYFTLAMIDGSPGCPWSPEFGSYVKADVEAELDEYLHRGWKRRELRILKTGDKQADIMAAIDKLNERKRPDVADQRIQDEAEAAERRAGWDRNP